MPTIEVNGTTLAYDEVGGSGPAVVFSHSLFFDRGMFAEQVSRFAGTHRVITYDHRGQGGSARSSALDLDTLAEDAAALVTALDAAPCHFVGNSMGGFVALRLAARHGDLLRSAVVMSSSAEEEHRADEFGALLSSARTNGVAATTDALAYLMFGDTTLSSRPALLAKWRARTATLDESILDAAGEVVHRKSVLGELVGLTVPLLVLSGAEDHAYGEEVGQRMADTAANAHHVVIGGAGHSLAVERPDAVNAQLAEHLSVT